MSGARRLVNVDHVGKKLTNQNRPLRFSKPEAAFALQMFSGRGSVADYRYAAALVAIAFRMSATSSR
jgi:hypothetical protein